MAGTTTNDLHNNSPFFLDSNQQDLLLAALTSNQAAANPNDPLLADFNYKAGLDGQNTQYPVFPPSYPIGQQDIQTSTFGSVEESPYVDYLDGDTSFDFDNADDPLMIGALPGDTSESSEKRKMSDVDGDEEDGGGKRREGDDKQAKKPGRKPLTSEPTTKRKAQNRAAQRAFRERKEKHLKDLETKVSDLEKASDATNHENGLLRAQVQRLQVELREYRKRLTLNSNNTSRSASLNNFSAMLGNGLGNGNFQFDFPRFGGLPGTQYLENGSTNKAKPSPSISSHGSVRQNSADGSASPASSKTHSMVSSPQQLNMGFSTGSVASSASNNPLGFQHVPASINAVQSGSNSIPASNSSGGSSSVSRHAGSVSSESASNPARVFRFNSGASSTHSESPSAFSNSAGQNSSCDTSPEPIHDSPKPQDAASFQSPLAPVLDTSATDFFIPQNGGHFDPALFGDYRDSQAAIVGDGDFTNGFFADAFPLTDFGSPFHFGDTPAVQKPNPLEQIEKLQNGVEEEVPLHDEEPAQMLNCHKIWDKLSHQAKFKEGTLDIDSLCSEFRARARCSEAGVVVDNKDVEAALNRAAR